MNRLLAILLLLALPLSVTFPNGTVDNGLVTGPAVVWVTNDTTFVCQVMGFGSTFTNVFSQH